jgi:hypothetical protein
METSKDLIVAPSFLCCGQKIQREHPNVCPKFRFASLGEYSSRTHSWERFRQPGYLLFHHVHEIRLILASMSCCTAYSLFFFFPMMAFASSQNDNERTTNSCCAAVSGPRFSIAIIICCCCWGKSINHARAILFACCCQIMLLGR